MADEPPAKINKPNKLSNKAGKERINWRIWKEQKKEEKRRCKESKLIQQLEKQKREEENKQQIQQEEKESKGALRESSEALGRKARPVSSSHASCNTSSVHSICGNLSSRSIKTCSLLAIQNEGKVYKGVVVAPHIPRTEAGLYWGYSVRLASCLSAVFTECPYKDGYDLTVGTSERGNSADHITLPPFKHMLVVFGGLQGLEASVDADENLNVADPGVLFDLYLNTCPGQGSRTIRTEEAILISLSGLRQKISAVFPDQPKG
uniref:SPOUT domain containing methyltransferase 1 n=1 Tax=Cyprinus carpio TaxID=7962 RepID=A0A8C1XUF0_CYPCA